MVSTPSFRELACIVVLLTATIVVRGDDGADASAKDAVDSRQWIAERAAELKEYDVSIAKGDPRVTVELVEQAVLNWSNPIRDTDLGAMFVWGPERPQLFCCCFCPDEATVVHEIVSVADEPLLVEGETTSKLLEPPDPFVEIPESMRPSKQRPLRLAQMRKQAARYQINVVGEDLTFETRLLSRPIYRYPEDADVDGAVFAFVQATDPECLLVIESREDGYVSRMARVTNWRLHVLLDGALVRDWYVDGDRSYGKFRRSLP